MKNPNVILVVFAIVAVALISTYSLRARATTAITTVTATTTAKTVTTASGLKYQELAAGAGAEAKPGQIVQVHYTGWLDESGKKGKKFDSSLDRGTPFEFPLGAGRVIRGWDEGVAGMKIGEKRELLIPANLGYGERGAGGAIPPNANLIFDVELLAVK